MISYFWVRVFWIIQGFRFVGSAHYFRWVVANFKPVHEYRRLPWSNEAKDYFIDFIAEKCHQAWWSIIFSRENCWRSNFFWRGLECFLWWWFVRRDCDAVSLIKKFQGEVHFGDIFILLYLIINSLSMK